MPTKCSINDCLNNTYSIGLCAAHYTRNRRHGNPEAGRTPQGEPFQWLIKHITYQGDDCLKWPYATRKGYGTLNYGGRQRVASSVMCELVYGRPTNPTHECAHSCGNGHLGCTNPRHLRWATRAENHQDMYLHGVRPLGERTKKNKISEDQVHAIRKAKANGVTVREIASMHGLSRSGVYLILSRKNWAWVA